SFNNKSTTRAKNLCFECLIFFQDLLCQFTLFILIVQVIKLYDQFLSLSNKVSTSCHTHSTTARTYTSHERIKIKILRRYSVGDVFHIRRSSQRFIVNGLIVVTAVCQASILYHYKILSRGLTHIHG